MIVIIEILSHVKSTSYDADNVEQLIASSPVTVNVKVDDEELPAPRSKVTIGGVLSTATVVEVVVETATVVATTGFTVVLVVAVVVVVVATVVVVVTVEVTKVHTSFLFDLAQTNLEPEVSMILPALKHLAPARTCADAVKGCAANIAISKQEATTCLRARVLTIRIQLVLRLIAMAQPNGFQSVKFLHESSLR